MQKKIIKQLDTLRTELSKHLSSLDVLPADLKNEEILTTKSGARKANQLIEQVRTQLAKLLTSSGIKLKQWGRGHAKTFNHLLNEFLLGETSFEISRRGELLRVVHLSTVDILYKNMKLVEERQVFEDGRVRIRQLSATVTEKIYPGEKPTEAARRGLKEELGLKNAYSLRKIRSEKNTVASPSYPGLKSKYLISTYKTSLTPAQYNPRGYVERNKEDGLTAYFVWKKED